VTQENATRSPIRVLIVDDSAFMRTALARMIASDPDLEVAGTAPSGSDALHQIPALDPDVITLDVEMPGLDGLETLRRIMAQFPRPVLMVSSLTDRDAEITFSALGAGAFDYVPKQLSPASLDIVHIRQDLIAKIKAAAQSRRQPSAAGRRKPPQAVLSFEQRTLSITPAIVAIGTSTGGPKALQEILPLFPRDLAVPILIVQHMPLGFTAPFAQRLNSLCSVPVCEATHHQPIQPGVVYIAPAGMHMTVERVFDSRPCICLTTEPKDSLHIPSANLLMQSVAATFHNLAMGVIMSGMGDDGSTGMAAIHREGGLTIGQDEDSCAVYGMPRVCAELGVLNRLVPLAQIPQQILQATRHRMHA
jgi:two-component system, chemotaxis family, protein-glutamate methylesterase/glutaminase